ncbi:hypothetical protein FA15DRAFT_435585 [Coprinopsis marcescibilis]|uniref:Uncharacterized protein n=1 Tax=Coprinopsis marcescibilis TaxID=230819 RepID=A0A5C3KV24_COPMA|nr:hypothetical protein FA15DRAFT_435585 [Coprinopsis marcescibilis]
MMISGRPIIRRELHVRSCDSEQNLGQSLHRHRPSQNWGAGRSPSRLPMCQRTADRRGCYDGFPAVAMACQIVMSIRDKLISASALRTSRLSSHPPLLLSSTPISQRRPFFFKLQKELQTDLFLPRPWSSCPYNSLTPLVRYSLPVRPLS